MSESDIVEEINAEILRVSGSWPENQFCLDLAARSAAAITALRAENEKLQTDLRLAVASDSEYCATLERINAAVLAAPTVDIDVVVPDRDYSIMTPRDCYEAGLLDGVYQGREAIKAAARAALGDTHMSDLRERVARAICEAFTEDPEMVDDFVDTGNLYPRKLWQSYLPFADAAIRALAIADRPKT